MEKIKEEKINQINYQLDLYHNQLNTNAAKFEKVYDELDSKFQYSRNSTLSVIALIIPILFSLTIIDPTKNFVIPEPYLAIGIILIISLAIGIYLYFAYSSKKKSSKYLNIQKVFHDAYTAINFMKGWINNRDFIDQLDIDQINYLDIYLAIVRGGIASKIRKTVANNVDQYLSEKQVYGDSEKDLYTYLIADASETYKKYGNIKEKVLAFSKDAPKVLFDIYDRHYTKDLLNN